MSFKFLNYGAQCSVEGIQQASLLKKANIFPKCGRTCDRKGPTASPFAVATILRPSEPGGHSGISAAFAYVAFGATRRANFLKVSAVFSYDTYLRL
eukprot:m.83685 g.83685  ORF g.83685 m.83685 type:complete len:96 (-) comp19660_c0_seq1:742-1029(-)